MDIFINRRLTDFNVNIPCGKAARWKTNKYEQTIYWTLIFILTYPGALVTYPGLIHTGNLMSNFGLCM